MHRLEGRATEGDQKDKWVRCFGLNDEEETEALSKYYATLSLEALDAEINARCLKEPDFAGPPCQERRAYLYRADAAWLQTCPRNSQKNCRADMLKLCESVGIAQGDGSTNDLRANIQRFSTRRLKSCWAAYD